MVKSKIHQDWNYTAALMAHTANLCLPEGETAKRPEDYHPLRPAVKKAPIPKVNFSALKSVFVDQRQ